MNIIKQHWTTQTIYDIMRLLRPHNHIARITMLMCGVVLLPVVDYVHCSTVMFVCQCTLPNIIQFLRIVQNKECVFVFIDIFNAMCENVGVAPTKVLDDIGMNRSSYTGWKNGSEPSNPTKKKLADYFHVSVKQLMSGQTEKPATTKDDRLEEDVEFFRSIIKGLNRNNRELVKAQAELLLRMQRKK